MKRLPPSLRQNKRYLKFKVHSEEEFELGDIVESVWDALLRYNGVEGTSKANPWVIGNLYEENQGVIRIRRESEDSFRAALCSLEKIDGDKAFVEIQKVSGSLKKIKESF